MPSTQGNSWVTSLRLAPVWVASSGMPAASQIRWRLVPARPRSTGEGPVRAPLKSADLAGVDDPARPVELAGSVEAAQQLAVQAFPHPSGLPVAQSPPSGHPRAADLLGHHAPRHAG